MVLKNVIGMWHAQNVLLPYSVYHMYILREVAIVKFIGVYWTTATSKNFLQDTIQET